MHGIYITVRYMISYKEAVVTIHLLWFMIAWLLFFTTFTPFAYTASYEVHHSHQFAGTPLFAIGHWLPTPSTLPTLRAPYNPFQIPLWPLKHVYKVVLHFTTLWSLWMQGWTFKIQGQCRFGHFWLLSYMFFIYFLINPFIPMFCVLINI